MPTFAVAQSPTALISRKCELWAVASETKAEIAYQVVVLPDGQAVCSCLGARSGNECKHIRRVRVERGEGPRRIVRGTR